MCVVNLVHHLREALDRFAAREPRSLTSDNNLTRQDFMPPVVGVPPLKCHGHACIPPQESSILKQGMSLAFEELPSIRPGSLGLSQ
jgi:hypothetical protein